MTLACAILLGACSGTGPEKLLLSGAADGATPAVPQLAVTATAPSGSGSGDFQLASASTTTGSTDGAARIRLMPLPDTLSAQRAEVLTKSMREMLAAQGYEIVSAPAPDADGEHVYTLDASISLEQLPDGGKEKIGIDWEVSDALGAPVGKITQTAEISDDASEGEWRARATLAAAAAAESLTRLVPRRGE